MTDTTWIYIVLALAVIGLVAGLIIGLRRRSTTASGRRPADQTTPRPPSVPTTDQDTDGREPGAAPPTPPLAPTSPTDEPGFGQPETTAQALEAPEAPGTRMRRLRARLAGSGALGNALLSILSRGELSESDWEEIEETLLLADVGTGPTDELLGELRQFVKISGTQDAAAVRHRLRELLIELVDPAMDRSLDLAPIIDEDGQLHPATVLVVGVNGTGKTTTVGKLARVLVAENHDVILGAADTFRAAAADQLTTWGERVGVPVVRSDRDGADPASVAFDAVRTGREEGADVVMVDTAGRLQNKSGLMDELGKIKRVISKGAPVKEVLLVIDATTGQNGMRQAQVFAEVVDITGIVLTKLDGTAKGGIVVAVQRELGVPVKFVGLGEGPDDLAPFDPEGFVDAILTN